MASINVRAVVLDDEVVIRLGGAGAAAVSRGTIHPSARDGNHEPAAQASSRSAASPGRRGLGVGGRHPVAPLRGDTERQVWPLECTSARKAVCGTRGGGAGKVLKKIQAARPESSSTHIPLAAYGVRSSGPLPRRVHPMHSASLLARSGSAEASCLTDGDRLVTCCHSEFREHVRDAVADRLRRQEEARRDL